MLLPGQAHRHPVDGQVHVVHDRAFFDLGLPITTGATHVTWDLSDHQLDVGSAAFKTHDSYVFETHQGGEDLTRVEQDEGASWLLATTSLKRLRLFLGDPAHQGLPAEIRRTVSPSVASITRSYVRLHAARTVLSSFCHSFSALDALASCDWFAHHAGLGVMGAN